MELCWFLRCVTFVVRFLDRLYTRCMPVVTAESRQPRFLKNWRISSHLLSKLESSLQRRLSLKKLSECMGWHFLRIVDERTDATNSYGNLLVRIAR